MRKRNNLGLSMLRPAFGRRYTLNRATQMQSLVNGDGATDLIFRPEEFNSFWSNMITFWGLMPVEKCDLCCCSRGVILEEEWSFVVASGRDPSPAP